MIKALRITLAFAPNTLDRDHAIVEAIRTTKLEITHLIVCTRSWQETPFALEHSLIKHLINICKNRGISIIWGRWLWRAWGAIDENEHDHLESSFYATAIKTIKVEASFIGAESFLDTEPYGEAKQLWMKNNEPSSYAQFKIESAIQLAIRYSDKVDYVSPSSSPIVHSAYWLLKELGIYKCDSYTFHSTPPNWETHEFITNLHLWGCHVGEENLKQSDIEQWNLEVIQERFPECLGIFIYLGANNIVRILGEWT